MRYFARTFAATFLLTLFPVIALAQEQPQVPSEPPQPVAPQPVAPKVEDKTYHKHDGFLLRLSPGFGGILSSELDHDTLSAKMSGWGTSGSFLLGASLSPNWYLGATSALITVFNPTLSIGSTDLQLDDTALDLEVYGAVVGAYWESSLSKHFNAHDYIQGGAGFARQVHRSGDESEPSIWGPSLFLAVGTEWWVSANWSLGISQSLTWIKTEIDDSEKTDNPSWQYLLWTVGLSATYN